MQRVVLTTLLAVFVCVAKSASRRDAASPAAGSSLFSATITFREIDGGAIGPVAPAPEVDHDEARRAVIRNKLRQAEAGTYIGEILLGRDSALARWRSRSKPLTVWIQPDAEIEDFTTDYVARVRHAFEEWDALELDGLRFAFSNDSALADIHVTWIDRFKDPISGRTRWARDESWWITDASITLAVHHSQGATLNLDAMKAMALHEIGHLIGLDHTADASSIMAPRVRVRDLSDADRATAKLLYTLDAGTVR
jgi:hypothetical protein